MEEEHYRGNMPQLELTLYNDKQMKFTAQRSDLLNALNIVGRCIGKSVMPILDNYRFQISGNTLNITGSSMEVFICKEITIESDIQSLDVCVPAKKLLDLIKALANQPLLFTIKSNDVKGKECFTAELKYSTGKVNIPLENGIDFPKTPIVESEPISLPNQDLINGFYKTTFAADTNEMMASSNMLLQFGNGILITGANPRYLSRTKVFENTINLADILIKKTALEIITSIGQDGETNISYSDSYICFEQPDKTKVFARTLDGKYPDLSKVFAIPSTKSIAVNLNDLSSALKRVVLFADLINKQIKISLSDQGITLETANEWGENAVENVSCEYSGEPFVIGVIADQITAVLGRIKTETVYLSFSTEKEPIKITENENDTVENMFLLIPSIITN
jgi:DNA polymerase-3 subunit beta